MRSLSVSPAHARWPARVPLGALLLFGLACAPRVTAPPAPARRGPTEAERAAARADSARARARQDSVREVAARAAAAAARERARPVRNDTIAARPLRAPFGLCAGGDVTLGTNLDTAWAHQASKRMREKFHRDDRPATLLAPLRPLIRSADIVLLNVESAIGAGRTASKCSQYSTNCYAFRSPPSSARALRALAPRRTIVGNVANNHARDAGPRGLDSTIAALGRAGVLVTGADTLATPVPTPAGDTIGVLGFYTSAEAPDARDTAAVHRHVARAAGQYPVVVATMHLGAEGMDAQRTGDSTEVFLGIDRGNPVAFAEAAVRGGAALVVGHGPHVLRALEWRDRGALIAYSLGNLLTYGPFVLKEPLNRGALLCATIDVTGRVSSAEVRSTKQRAPGVLEVDREARAAALTDSLGTLDFPDTGARVDRTGKLRPRVRR
ncbi:MAG: CapA family protein [Gemmatimonadaceae bacterium]|nr:CapA family protein [Gemmatimonadaceae bacterium]